MKHYPNAGRGRLWAARRPLPNESRASWIQRLCGDHQYTFSQLTEATGLKAWRMDWDKTLQSSGWERLMRMADIDRDELLQTEWLMHLDQDIRGGFSVFFHETKPCYRWCGACFEADRTPHLRWYWRLACIRECWTHGTPLNEKCQVCGFPFVVDQARLTRRCTLTLAECPRCGMTLTTQNEDGDAYDWREQRRYRKAISHRWGIELQETPDIRPNSPALRPSGAGSFQRWTEASTLPPQGIRAELTPTDVAIDLAGPPLTESGNGAGQPPLSKAKLKKLAAEELARKETLAQQISLMHNEENRVRFRELFKSVHGVNARVHGLDHRQIVPKPNRLPWHWVLHSLQRGRLALSILAIRHELRAAGAAPEQGSEQ